jgi:hypothetical protein
MMADRQKTLRRHPSPAKLYIIIMKRKPSAAVAGGLPLFYWRKDRDMNMHDYTMLTDNLNKRRYKQISPDNRTKLSFASSFAFHKTENKKHLFTGNKTELFTEKNDFPFATLKKTLFRIGFMESLFAMLNIGRRRHGDYD